MSVEGTTRNQNADETPLIDVRNLQTAFFTDKETIRAVDGISMDIDSGETVGIVGESGSGKSVTARSIMGLVEQPGRVLRGSSVRFHQLEAVKDYAETFSKHTVDVTELRSEHNPGELLDKIPSEVTAETFGREQRGDVTLTDILAAGYGDELDITNKNDCVFITERAGDSPEDITAGFIEVTRLDGERQRQMRGGRIAMVFQDPLTSLNPVFTVGNQIKEALNLHRGLSGEEATREAVELLEAVGIPDAGRRVNEYPHQFSGGMRQRAVIAMALACEPELLICDEPTTALDVTIQAQILELLAEIQEERDIGIMFITHDMGVIAEVSDKVNVMYAGEVIEQADVYSLFESPKHPYTRGLLRSIPGTQSGERLETIEGNVPTPTEAASDCRFAPRCPKAFDACEVVHPSHVGVGEKSNEHTAACLLYPEEIPETRRVEIHRGGDGRGDSK
ncbi:ABC transporter ATP-binding protein [Halovenus salina]|uniref:Nickel import system ATP-binding protein NikD n=1 Tax=Halovenus salina TaxID=1510225 RepID=A0ABD5VYC6_9EURY|nr:ABC transporter ATP-binding protein [Halovenus salina]